MHNHLDYCTKIHESTIRAMTIYRKLTAPLSCSILRGQKQGTGRRSILQGQKQSTGRRQTWNIEALNTCQGPVRSISDAFLPAWILHSPFHSFFSFLPSFPPLLLSHHNSSFHKMTLLTWRRGLHISINC